MVRYFITRPVSVIMTYLVLVIFGIFASESIPISLLPNIQVPEIVVHINKKAASSLEIENTITRRVRNDLMLVSNLDDIQTRTRAGYSTIHLKFNHKVNINDAFIEVNEKIDLLMNSLPREMERPRVVKTNLTDIPVFNLTLSLKDTSATESNVLRFHELNNFAVQVIKRRLEQLPEIGFVDITGMSYPEIFIKPNLQIMASMNFKKDDFKRIIEINNLQYSPLLVQEGQLEYNLGFESINPVSVSEIKEINFKHGGRIFKLKDIAEIGIRRQAPKGYFLANNKPAINLAITKQADSRLDDLRENIQFILAKFESDYPEIEFDQMEDQTELLEFSILSLKQDLFAGSILAFIMMFFFLKNFRTPILIAIVIPVCIILCILFFNLINLSINIISLSGMILSVGLMIDNSIIVIENITQYRNNKVDVIESCVQGTNEVIRPLISSALTTCSVFLPLIFLSGISGTLFYDQAVAITIGLGVSLIVSISLLPTLYLLIHKGKVIDIENKFFEKYGITLFESVYDNGLNWVFRNKSKSVVIVLIFILSNVFLFTSLEKEKLPLLNETELMINIDWNMNISIDENRNRVLRLTDYFKKDLLQSNAKIGEQQYLLNKDLELSNSEAKIYFKVRDMTVIDTINKLIKLYLLEKYPIAKFEVSSSDNFIERIFGGYEPSLTVQVSNKGSELLPDKAKVDSLIFYISSRFPSSIITAVPVQNAVTLNIDLEKLVKYNLSIDNVYNTLKSELNTNEVGFIRDGQQEIPMVMDVGSGLLDKDIKDVMVINDKGVPIPISSLLTFRKESTYKEITGGKNGNFIPLHIESIDPQNIIDFLKDHLFSNENFGLLYSGSYFSNRILIKEMALVLCVSFLLLYFILAAQFESLMQPLIVLLELPISMSGSLIMLYLYGSSINIISMIGIIVMSGIIINDSILKIDTINQLRRKGKHTLMEAIHVGGRRRLKSIIMTSMTTILSVAPFLFGSDMGSMLQKPLSIALIGGMLIGTPVSLYFIPLVYWFHYRKDEKNLNVAN